MAKWWLVRCSHFILKNLMMEECTFTSDRGYEYEVQITGPPCFSTDERKARYDKEGSTCPKCGEEKSSYDKYCDDCQDEICPKCGRDKYLGRICNTCTDRLENNVADVDQLNIM